jgi:hypothetical protein
MRSILSLIEPSPEYVIEIILARIEYVKSVAVLLAHSDEPRLICLLFFTSLVRRLLNRSVPIKSGGAEQPSCKILSLKILNEPLFDFMRLVEFRGRFLNVGIGAVLL